MLKNKPKKRVVRKKRIVPPLMVNKIVASMPYKAEAKEISQVTILSEDIKSIADKGAFFEIITSYARIEIEKKLEMSLLTVMDFFSKHSVANVFSCSKELKTKEDINFILGLFENKSKRFKIIYDRLKDILDVDELVADNVTLNKQAFVEMRNWLQRQTFDFETISVFVLDSGDCCIVDSREIQHDF